MLTNILRFVHINKVYDIIQIDLSVFIKVRILHDAAVYVLRRDASRGL